MSKILECIYAYLCKNNYTGLCGSGDEIFNLTEGTSEQEKTLLRSLAGEIKRMDLKYVSNNGLKKDSIDEENIENEKSFVPNYDKSSFAYYPRIRENKYALCCFSLRKSLKEDRKIRGSKELNHLILFDDIPKDFYVIDMIKSEHFKQYNDIAIEDNEEDKKNNIVTEVIPTQMPSISFNGETFNSHLLEINDITAISDELNTKLEAKIKIISEIYHALSISKQNQKTLYIAYHPTHYQTLLDYLTVTLKFMPAKIANQISFVTYLGNVENAKLDICCIPTCDKNKINQLKEAGYVIQITEYDNIYLREESKNSFADLLDKYATDKDEVTKIINQLNKYYNVSALTRMEQLNVIAKLCDNKMIQDDDSRITAVLKSGGVSTFQVETILEEFSSIVEVISNNYDFIFRIEGELDEQINIITKKLESILGCISYFTPNDIQTYVLNPILNLLSNCNTNEMVMNHCFSWLRMILFGLNNQSENVPQQLQEKQFEIVSSCFKSVCDQLGNYYKYFISDLELNWNSLCDCFFKNYFDELQYHDSFDRPSNVALLILSKLEVNLSSKMYEFLAKSYLQHNPRKYEKLLDLIFSKKESSYQNEICFVFEKLLNDDYNVQIPEIVKYIYNYGKKNNLAVNSLFQNTMDYIISQYIKYGSKNTTFGTTLKELLKYYFECLDNTLKSICNSFEKVKQLIEKYPSEGFKEFVLENWYEIVALPKLVVALNNTHFENITKEDYENYQKLLIDLNDNNETNIFKKEFLDSFDKYLKNIGIFLEQKESEKDLLDTRIQFVTRELSLLNNKKIIKILSNEKYLGKEQINNFIEEKEIKKKKKDKRIVEFAVDETTKYLSSSNPNAATLCNEIRKKRVANIKDYLFSSGIGQNIIGALLFIVAMTVIATLLSLIVYKEVFNSYFISFCFVFSIIIALFSGLTYFLNYGRRRFHNVLLMSFWQVLLLIIASLGMYTLIQYLFLMLGV